MQIMGCIRKKNRLGQKFLVSCILYVDTRKAGKTDDLEASVNYGTISHLIKEKMEEEELQADRSSSRAACRRDLII